MRGFMFFGVIFLVAYQASSSPSHEAYGSDGIARSLSYGAGGCPGGNCNNGRQRNCAGGNCRLNPLPDPCAGGKCLSGCSGGNCRLGSCSGGNCNAELKMSAHLQVDECTGGNCRLHSCSGGNCNASPLKVSAHVQELAGCTGGNCRLHSCSGGNCNASPIKVSAHLQELAGCTGGNCRLASCSGGNCNASPSKISDNVQEVAGCPGGNCLMTRPRTCNGGSCNAALLMLARNCPGGNCHRRKRSANPCLGGNCNPYNMNMMNYQTPGYGMNYETRMAIPNQSPCNGGNCYGNYGRYVRSAEPWGITSPCYKGGCNRSVPCTGINCIKRTVDVKVGNRCNGGSCKGFGRCNGGSCK